MLPDCLVHGLVCLGHAILHALDLPLGLLELLFRLLELILQVRYLVLQGLYLRFKVRLDSFLPLNCLLMRFLDLLDYISMVLLFLRDLLVKFGVHLSDILLMRLL